MNNWPGSMSRLRSVEAGEPQVVVLAGDAGIGKSRLLEQLADESRSSEPFA